MKDIDIYHHKFSLFQLEEDYPSKSHNLINSCFKYIETFDSLVDAKSAQEKLKYKSIILPSY